MPWSSASTRVVCFVVSIRFSPANSNVTLIRRKRKLNAYPHTVFAARNMAYAAEFHGMLAHGHQPDAFVAGGLLRKSATVIFENEFGHRTLCHERERETSGAGVAQNIRNTLLSATIQRNFNSVRRLKRQRPNIDFHLDQAHQATRLNQMAKGVSSGKALPIRRMEVVGDSPDLLDSLFSQRLHTS